MDMNNTFERHQAIETDLHADPPLREFDGGETQPIDPIPRRCYELPAPRWLTPDRSIEEALADEWKRRVEHENLQRGLRWFERSLGRPY